MSKPKQSKTTAKPKAAPKPATKPKPGSKPAVNPRGGSGYNDNHHGH